MSLPVHQPRDREHTDTQSGGPDNVVSRLFSAIFGNADPDKQRKRKLKQIAKTLKKRRVRLYRPRGDLAEPGLGRFFYQIYRVLGPAGLILSRSDATDSLRTTLIESFLSEEQRSSLGRLTEEAIRDRTQKTDPKTAIQTLRDELKQFAGGFDAAKSGAVNQTYRLLTVLLELINFDYFFLLKKFDAGFPENDFVYKPRFESINGTYVLDDLKDFLDSTAAFDPAAEWTRVLEILREFRGVDIVDPEGWKRVLQLIRDAKRSEVLEMVAQLIARDPAYEPSSRGREENVVESYLTRIKNQTEMTVQKIAQEKRTGRIQQLTKIVFGSVSVSRLTNYSEKLNTLLVRKKVGGFTHVESLNYLKAYLVDYLKKDIRDIVDLLLIKGKWSTNEVSEPLSEAYHQLLSLSVEVVEFDDSLAEDGDLGRRMKGLALKSNKDKNSNNQLWQLVKKTNDTAKTMIVSAAQNLIVVGKTLKLSLDDYTRKDHTLVINWREIQSATDEDVEQLIVAVYKQIYHFLELLKLYQ